MKSGNYHYWKKSWGPLAVLAAGVLNLILAVQTWGDYRNVQRVADEVFTPEQYLQYSHVLQTQVLLQGLVAFSMFAILLIGALSRSATQARRLETILLGGLAVVILGWALSSHAASPVVLWIFVAVLLVGAGQNLRAFRRAKEQENQA